MRLQINIRNISVNSMTALGSINVGKIFYAENHASRIQVSKPGLENAEVDEEQLLAMVPHPPSNSNQAT